MYALSLFSEAVLSLYRCNQMRRPRAAGIASVHTCLGTPTLGPALPVDIREPLGGILTLIEEQAQQRWRVEVSRLRAEATM